MYYESLKWAAQVCIIKSGTGFVQLFQGGKLQQKNVPTFLSYFRVDNTLFVLSNRNSEQAWSSDAFSIDFDRYHL